MNAFSMSGLILGGLAFMLSILLLVQTPGAVQQAVMLDLPLKAFQQQPLPPPIPFALGATAASILAWRSKWGKYIVLGNLLVLAGVIALFV